MTQQNQSNTSKQNQDKEQQARALNEQLANEQKQNQIDKQHNQEHNNGQTAKTHSDEKSDTQPKGKDANAEQTVQKESATESQSDKKTESFKIDDLKAKAIAIGEELLQKGERLLNELKNGKSEAKQNGEVDDSKQAAHNDAESGQQKANGQDQQDRMTHLKDEAMHKFEDTRQKITDLFSEASVKFAELKQMATDTMNKMKDNQSKDSDSDPQQDAKDTDSANSSQSKKDESQPDQDNNTKDQQDQSENNKNHK